MAITFDGTTKLINLSSGTVSLSVRNLWTAWVNWISFPEIIFKAEENPLIDLGKTRGIGSTRNINPLNSSVVNTNGSKYLFAMSSVGGNTVDADISIPVYVFLENGWKIKPQETNHTLTVYDGILISSDGLDPFTDTIGNYRVNIRYRQPVQAISFRPTYTDPVKPATHTLTGSIVASEATLELSKVIALTAEINASEAVVEASAVVQELLDGNIISTDADFSMYLTHSLIKESEIFVFVISTPSDIQVDIYNPIKLTSNCSSDVSSISGDLTKIYTYSIAIASRESNINGTINTTKEITGNLEAVSSDINLEIQIIKTLTGNVISDNSVINIETSKVVYINNYINADSAIIDLDITNIKTLTGNVISNTSSIYGLMHKVTKANINIVSKSSNIGFSISTSLTANIKASNATLNLVSYLEDIAKYYKIFSSLDINMNYVIGSSLVDNNYLLAGFKSNRSTLNINWDIISRTNLTINMQSQNSRIKSRLGIEKITDAPEEMIIILPVETIIEIEQVENIIEVVE